MNQTGEANQGVPGHGHRYHASSPRHARVLTGGLGYYDGGINHGMWERLMRYCGVPIDMAEAGTRVSEGLKGGFTPAAEMPLLGHSGINPGLPALERRLDAGRPGGVKVMPWVWHPDRSRTDK